MGRGAQTQHQPQQLQHFNPRPKAAKLLFCTETSHGKCYSDHSFDYDTTGAWEVSCEEKKSLSSQTSKMFKVLLIHIQATFFFFFFLSPPENCSPVRRRDQQCNKRRSFQVQIHLEIITKTKMLGSALCPREKLFAAAQYRAQLPLKPRVSTCLQGM